MERCNGDVGRMGKNKRLGVMKIVKIAFSKQTSIWWVKILCRNFRHCMVLDYDSNVVIQVGLDRVRLFQMDNSVEDRLVAAGWVLVSVSVCSKCSVRPSVMTCVGFAKKSIGVWWPFVWTPDQLYKRISKK